MTVERELYDFNGVRFIALGDNQARPRQRSARPVSTRRQYRRDLRRDLYARDARWLCRSAGVDALLQRAHRRVDPPEIPDGYSGCCRPRLIVLFSTKVEYSFARSSLERR